MSNDLAEPAGVPAVTTDALLDGRVTLRQPATGYRVAIDPVLLAAAVPAQAGESVLDAGCGVGAAALCLAARVDAITIDGLEVDARLVALARENAGANRFGERVSFHAGDLEQPPPALAPRRFDHVMTNPPHLEAARTQASPRPTKARAHVEGRLDLGGWLIACLRLLRPRGGLTLIHRADRLDHILAALHGRAGAIVIMPLWPKAGRPAKRVILRAVKGAGGRAGLLPGLVLHENDGGYTPAAEAILRQGGALEA